LVARGARPDPDAGERLVSEWAGRPGRRDALLLWAGEPLLSRRLQEALAEEAAAAAEASRARLEWLRQGAEIAAPWV